MSDPEDVVKSAGRFFSKLGSQLGSQLKDAAKVAGKQLGETGKVVGKQLEHTSKQVTGLGRGAVKLELDHTRVTPGGTLQGRLVLSLTERVEAQRVVVLLRARQRFVVIKRGEADRGIGATYAPVYQVEQELAPAGTYEDGTYVFALEVPPDALDLRPQPVTTGPLADVARTVTSALTPGPIEWQVIGRVEIRLGRDLASEVDITIAG